jgi:hypothetical protein
MNANLIGQNFGNVLKFIPRLSTSEEMWEAGSKGYDVSVGEKIFLAFPKTVVGADGNRILIHNRQADNWGRYTLERRARHLFMYSESANAIDPQKAKLLPNIIKTLQNAQFILRDSGTGCLLYGARFQSNRIQLVVVKPKANPKGPDAVTSDLLSQFIFDGTGKQRHFQVCWVCPEPPPEPEPDKKNSPQ